MRYKKKNNLKLKYIAKPYTALLGVGAGVCSGILEITVALTLRFSYYLDGFSYKVYIIEKIID